MFKVHVLSYCVIIDATGAVNYVVNVSHFRIYAAVHHRVYVLRRNGFGCHCMKQN